MFYYWYNLTDTPAILGKINIFFYINARIFKIKLNAYISYLIVTLSGFKVKNVKTFFNVLGLSIFILSFLCFSPFFFNGFFYLILYCGGVVAEWLRRMTVNHMGDRRWFESNQPQISAWLYRIFMYCFFAAIIHFLSMKLVKIVEKGKPRDFRTNVRYYFWLCVVYIWVIFTYFVGIEVFYYSLMYPLLQHTCALGRNNPEDARFFAWKCIIITLFIRLLIFIFD